MELLPVASRELLVAARRRGTAWSRVLSASLALAVVFFLIATSRHHNTLGPRLLGLLTLILLIEALLAGVRYTCDCISEEKRDGTLGLLFLTNLSGFDVVLGKIVARAMPALYNLLAVAPVFGLSLLFGGVTGTQVAWLAVVLLVAMCLSLSVGVFVSAVGRNERKVLLGTLLGVALISFAPPVLWKVESWTLGTRSVDALLLLSPVHAYVRASAGAIDAGRSCLTMAVTSVLLLGFASVRVRHAFRASEPADRPEQGSARPARRWRELLQLNPMYWLAMRGKRIGRWWLFAGALALFGLFARIVLEAQSNRAVIFVAIFGSYGLHLLGKFLLVEESVRLLNNDRRSGALELLLSTPLPPGFILRGQTLAYRRIFWPIATGLIAMNLIWMTERDFFRSLGVMLPGSIVLIFSDAQALLWRGMHSALRGERYVMTAMRTFFQVILPPLAVVVAFFFVLSSSGASSEGVQLAFLLWMIASIAYNLSLAKHSKNALQRFRALAAGDKWAPAWVEGGNPHRILRPQPAA